MMKLCFVLPKRKIYKIFLKVKSSDSNPREMSRKQLQDFSNNKNKSDTRTLVEITMDAHSYSDLIL